MLDLYCERTAPGLWGEPVNTLSNLAFFWAAWACWRMVQGRESGRPLSLLVILIAWLAVGSTLFHMVAERWAQILDVTPIWLFQVCWVWLYARSVVGFERGRTVVLLAGFLIIVLIGSQLRHILNGSLPYAPALVLVGLFGIHHRKLQRESPNSLLSALACFAAALFFRIIDLSVCETIPIGTHFLWHILNGAVIYFSMKALSRNWAKNRP